MFNATRLLPAIFVISSFPSFTADLPPTLQAKFIKIICTSANQTSVSSKDSNVNEELKKIGVTVDPGAKIAWAASESETASQKNAGKLVITSSLQFLLKGGSIAVVEENGKPQIYLHMGNISNSSITLSDSILKIGKRL